MDRALDKASVLGVLAGTLLVLGSIATGKGGIAGLIIFVNVQGLLIVIGAQKKEMRSPNQSPNGLMSSDAFLKRLARRLKTLPVAKLGDNSVLISMVMVGCGGTTVIASCGSGVRCSGAW